MRVFLAVIYISFFQFAFFNSANAENLSCPDALNNVLNIIKSEFEAPLVEVEISPIPFWSKINLVHSIGSENSRKVSKIAPLSGCKYKAVLKVVELHPLSPLKIDQWGSSPKIIFWYKMNDGPKIAQIVLDRSKQSIVHVMLSQPKGT